MAGYDDRDGFIWMDGKLVEWRSANVHILTHALHYASSVFEGERCYNGKIFKGHEHSLRLLESGRLLDMPIPYTAEQIDAAKEGVLKANGLTEPFLRHAAQNAEKVNAFSNRHNGQLLSGFLIDSA